MSVQVMAWVWNHAPADLSGTEQSVAIALANYASDEGGKAYPSVAKLCEITHWSERTVRATLQSLVDKGVIEIEQEATNKTPAVYCFPLYRGAVGAPQATSRGASRAPQLIDRGASPAPLEESRGASGASRGAAPPVRGAAPAPKPLLTVIEPRDTPLYPPKSTRDGRKTRWEREWQMPPEWAEYARDHGEDPEDMFTEFGLHWLATGQAMADWLATWQGWVRRAPKFRRPGKASSETPRQLRPGTPEWAAATGKAVL